MHMLVVNCFFSFLFVHFICIYYVIVVKVHTHKKRINMIDVVVDFYEKTDTNLRYVEFTNTFLLHGNALKEELEKSKNTVEPNVSVR